MSLINGHKDVLVRVDRDGVFIDALSQVGFKWARSRFGTVRSVFYTGNSREVGRLISFMLASRLSIEVRGNDIAA